MFQESKRNKKGNIISDSFIIVIVLFIFSILIPFMFKIFSAWNDNIQTSNVMSNTTKTVTQTMTTQMPLWLDNVLIAGFIFLWIGSLIAAFLIDSNPGFFVFMFILWIFLLIGFAWLSNTYTDMMASEQISLFNASFPKTAFIMEHIVQLMVAVGITIGMSLFAKGRQ